MLAENPLQFNRAEAGEQLVRLAIANAEKSNAALTVTWAGAPNNQFKKCIGTKVGRDGKSRPRIFWLGKDHAQAVHKAHCYLAIWNYRELLGAKCWTEEMEKLAEEAFVEEQNMAQFVANGILRQVESLREQHIPLPSGFELQKPDVVSRIPAPPRSCADIF